MAVETCSGNMQLRSEEGGLVRSFGRGRFLLGGSSKRYIRGRYRQFEPRVKFRTPVFFSTLTKSEVFGDVGAYLPTYASKERPKG